MLLLALIQILGFASANSLGEMVSSPQNHEINAGGSVEAEQQTSRTTSPKLSRPTSFPITKMTTTLLTTVRETRQPPVVVNSTQWSTIYATKTEVLPAHRTTVTATRTTTIPKTVTVTSSGETKYTTTWSTNYNTATSTLPQMWRTATITSYLIKSTTLYSKLSIYIFALRCSVINSTLGTSYERTETNKYVKVTPQPRTQYTTYHSTEYVTVSGIRTSTPTLYLSFSRMIPTQLISA
jgi:hypothetical protein